MSFEEQLSALLTETERLNLRQAKNSLYDFSAVMAIEPMPAAHHKLICNKLDQLANKQIRRLMILMPPGYAKSTYASVLFPPYYMAKFPKRKIVAGSYNTDLAEYFGKKARQVADSQRFFEIWQQSLHPGAGRAKSEWGLTNGSEYYGTGVGSGVTGRRSDIILIDDPFKSRKEADSSTVRTDTWNWYMTDIRSRAKPDCGICVINCMVGGTPVLMADGTHRELRSVRVGDEISTYEEGRLSFSKILNWRNNGPDYVYKIRTRSGRIVKANAKHPFLICRNGGTEWVRLQNLRVGENLIRMGSIGENGAESSVQLKSVTDRPNAVDSVIHTIIKRDGLLAIEPLQSTRSHNSGLTCVTDTGLMRINSKPSRPPRAGSVLSAESLRLENIGELSCASTTATIPNECAACSATTATSPSGTGRQSRTCSGPLSTCAITHDPIVEITEAGYEDVFDIEVDRTENFIANGLVSHNTRWHEDDICGRILNWGPQMNIEEEAVYVSGSGLFEAYDGEMWEVLSLPAIAEPGRVEGRPREKSKPLGMDAMGREEGEVLWPGYYTKEAVYQEKKSQDDRNWAALWQCRPSPEEGDFFKRENLRFYSSPPQYMRIYGSSDYAVTKDGGDFTELGIFGVDDQDHIYALDWWFGKENSLVWMENLFRLQEIHKCALWFEEKGQIEKSMGPIIVKSMTEKRNFFSQYKIAMKHDKVMRAQTIRARMGQGMVHFPAKGSHLWGKWVDHVVGQLLVFPAGTNDDAVDVLSLLGLGLGAINKAHIPLVKSSKPGYLTFDEMCRDEPAPRSAYRL